MVNKNEIAISEQCQDRDFNLWALNEGSKKSRINIHSDYILASGFV